MNPSSLTEIHDIESGSCDQLEQPKACSEISISGDITRECGTCNVVERNIDTLTLKSACHKILVTLSVVFGIFISTMCETAVSTVTESISQDFQTFGSLTWIAGGYLLTAVAFTPLVGKLSDIFGRKPVELFTIATFAIGSLGCALANSMIMFIVFRTITGIGGGGLMSMGFIMVSDVIPIEQRSTYLGFISLTIAAGQILGPIFGGLIGEVSWRIVFYLMLPLCAVLALLVIFVLDLPKSEGDILSKSKRVDFLGCITLILTSVALILATNWGGKDYAWSSPQIIILFILMIVFLIAFLFVQWKVASEPVLPSRVFVRNVICANIACFMAGAVQYVAIFYLPIYFQFVQSTSTSVSGYILSSFLGFISILCMGSGYLVQIFNTIRGVMWVGGIINIIGVCLVAFARQNATLAEQVIYVLINGIGLGLIFQLIIFTCTLSIAPEDVAIISGFFMFTLHIGGVVSLAIVGSVYNNVLAYQITTNFTDISFQELLLPSVVQTLSQANKEILRTCYYIAFKYVYICTIPFSILLLLSLLGLTKLKIPKKSKETLKSVH